MFEFLATYDKMSKSYNILQLFLDFISVIGNCSILASYFVWKFLTRILQSFSFISSYD